MPKDGLYSIPRHHLYNGEMLRPIYNSKDFAQSDTDDPTRKASKLAEGAHVSKDHQKQYKKRAKKHEAEGKSTDLNGGSLSTAPGATDASLNDHSTGDNRKRHAKYRKEKKEKSAERKSKREANVGASTSDDAIASAMRDLDRFQVMLESEKQDLKEKKKAGKRKRKSEGDVNINLSSQKQKKSKKTPVKPPNTAKESTSRSAIHGSPQKAKSRYMTESTQTPEKLMQSTHPTPTKTPVPFPRSTRKAVTPDRSLTDEPQGNAREVLVPETPPSVLIKTPKLVSKTPIPFPILHDTTPKHLVIYPSSEPGSMHPASMASFSEVPSMTSMMKIRQPLADGPKPRPAPKPRSNESSTDTSSCASSEGIPDKSSGFIKAYTPSDGRFTPVEDRKPYHGAGFQQASMQEFNKKFLDLQILVNFDQEKEYLDLHLDWNAENQTDLPLPCLGSATGCSAKKEYALRLAKDEKLSMPTLIDQEPAPSDHDLMGDVDYRTHEAENFLIVAMAARIPVPLGRLDGTWTLFCPQYSQHHVDRYGYGMRTLEIKPIAGFKDRGVYTARLNIPPRSMSYNIVAFTAPPHASFRVTKLVTGAEGYEIDVIFLGNGYLQMRVDLNLLLRGKPTEMVGGRKAYMEFLGVHENALQWNNRVNTLSEGGDTKAGSPEGNINA
ncbi:hypothetical protein BU24DRAFT_480505 [Aaosphaeria arxii CBS 175.79]|uniref:Uncharacterized protein n=1 Tax=Aaosphaeria arxii CBS 175.79 TaxID=1450172 RepID=A0A6A5XS78_9PLEO|nr:uncharacterized protein BU24DRAFT_480505 [Aaosphaeria arxii CBS 175.79]KAF2015793.1 hypothetical protein BU24DRAFT_480505 [Aaosphaeria arxii CBS 175.79]